MQFAFVAGRNILGSSLMAHELARGYHKETKDMQCAFKVNDKKSYLYFSSGTDLLKHETLQQIGYQEGELPMKYLGIPLSSTRLKKEDHDELVEKI
ncbi:zf-RVT domain-containing protein [Gossypium australe]|uniref:Zf-RVT domain-containing protein n=1 Tax=Gossypium australe TaxID=47621 RepID=A0A5B6VQ61_9ROSI|nr:zf-RVT domain-containing protein [Gossypium australe]